MLSVVSYHGVILVLNVQYKGFMWFLKFSYSVGPGCYRGLTSYYRVITGVLQVVQESRKTLEAGF